MSAINLDEIRRRAEKATPGPWRAEIHDGFYINGRPAECVITAGDKIVAKLCGPDAITIYHPTTGFSTGHKPGANAIFIAHAREDVLALLDHIAALERKCRSCTKR